jgi:cytochrome d ubiquinol oxidase subunit I
MKAAAPRWDDAARFWIGVFGINFAVGVVTGVPMEFQFRMNWAGFSRIAGGVIGQTLAMEGLFAFFLASSLLGLLACVWPLADGTPPRARLGADRPEHGGV